MSEVQRPQVGLVCWRDLTVENAAEVRDFYSAVTGWTASAQSMGEYDDYNMTMPESGETVAGICHARGSNANVPPQWLIYIAVENVEESAACCRELGGEVIDGPRPVGKSRFCVIRDPAGAVAALISTP